MALHGRVALTVTISTTLRTCAYRRAPFGERSGWRSRHGFLRVRTGDVPGCLYALLALEGLRMPCVVVGPHSTRLTVASVVHGASGSVGGWVGACTRDQQLAMGGSVQSQEEHMRKACRGCSPARCPVVAKWQRCWSARLHAVLECSGLASHGELDVMCWLSCAVCWTVL